MTKQARRQTGVPPNARRIAADDAGMERPPEGHITVGISFLSESEDRPGGEELQEWKRYVHDRLQHFTISHR